MVGRVMDLKDVHYQTTPPQNPWIRPEVFAGVTKLRTLRWSIQVGLCQPQGPHRGRREV